MTPKRLAIAAACLVLLAIICLGHGWNGNASANLGYPWSACSVALNGSAHGGSAAVAILSVLAAIVVAIASAVSLAVRQTRRLRS